MKISFFGSSLLSAYWNGAATYYRGLIKAMHAKGHEVRFFEPDAYGRQQRRDAESLPYAEVIVYAATEEGWRRALDAGADCDLLVKASGVGVFDRELEEAVSSMSSRNRRSVFWDVDAPATLERVAHDRHDPFRNAIPRFDLIACYGGGPMVEEGYKAFGAQDVVLIYNGLDPETHHPVAGEAAYAADVSFLGNRLPDREARVEEFFLKPAAMLPHLTFRLGGEGWQGKPMPPNVVLSGHVPTQQHNAFNCSSTISLNITRESMTRFGYSPATRVFEVAGAGCCLISDHWEGMGAFFEPGREILLARDGEEMAAILAALTPARAREIGEAARRRALAEHTYQGRAETFLKRIG